MGFHKDLKNMDQVIQVEANEWGRQSRKWYRDSGSIHGTLGRIREEGAVGAAIRAFRDNVPDVLFHDEEVARFHKQWIDLNQPDKLQIWMHYVEDWNINKICKFMLTSKRTYYSRLRRVLMRMALEANYYR